MSSLDIEAAIAAHRSWAKRLSFYIDGGSYETLMVSGIRDHAACVLGRSPWS
jgi:hypothetical protein